MWRLWACFILSVWIAGTGTAASADSAYTSLKSAECRTVGQTGEDNGTGAIQECPGRDGFRVQVVGDDARSWLRIQPPRSAAVDFREETAAQAPGQFPNVAETALEWRYANRRDRPAAFIHRIAATVGDSDRSVSVLLVIRVTEDRLCVIGRATGNVEARVLADSPRTCR